MATATPQARIAVGPADDGRRVSAEDYFRIEVQAGYRCELARGVLEVSQIPDEIHALLVCFFYDALSAYRRAHPGRIFLYGGASEFHFWLPGMPTGRNPDVAVSCAMRRSTLRARGRPRWLSRSSRRARRRATATTLPSGASIWPTAWASTGSSIGLSAR